MKKIPFEKTEKIKKLNDELRQTLGPRCYITSGVSQLDWPTKALILQKVLNYKDFNKGNDPYGEHDFGSFEAAGHNIFWKIDYYDKENLRLSEDPADPEKTNRVLTILLAKEY